MPGLRAENVPGCEEMLRCLLGMAIRDSGLFVKEKWSAGMHSFVGRVAQGPVQPSAKTT